MTSLMTQADRVFPGGVVLNKQGHTAEFLEDGMHQVMGIGNDDDALRVLLRDADPDLEPTIFAYGWDPTALEEGQPVVHTRDCCTVSYSLSSNLVNLRLS